MKQSNKSNKIKILIIMLIIIIGIIMVAIKGFNFDLKYKNTQSIELHLQTQFNISDIKNITNEVLGKQKVMIQKVEVESEYEGLDEVKENPENYYIEDIKQIAYPNTIENQIIISKKEAEADNQTLIANDTQPALFDENQKEQKARLFIEKFGGMFSGAYHPTKSAKELKREKLDQDLKEGKI